MSWPGWLVTYKINVPHRELNTDTVTHPSTNWAQRRLTSLIETVSYRRTVYLLLELLFVKCGSLSVSCLSQADITYAIDSICTS